MIAFMTASEEVRAPLVAPQPSPAISAPLREPAIPAETLSASVLANAAAVAALSPNRSPRRSCAPHAIAA